jgi:hypothetical protein
MHMSACLQLSYVIGVDADNERTVEVSRSKECMTLQAG